MTNKEKILDEMAGMTTAQMVEAIWDGGLRDQLDAIMCRECEAAHGGECPVGEGDCEKTLEGWLGEECTREYLIGEKRAGKA